MCYQCSCHRCQSSHPQLKHHSGRAVMAGVFLLLLLTLGSPELVSGDQTNTEQASLADRMGQLERMLLEQGAKLSRQDALLGQQGERLAYQEARISQQERLLLDQDKLIQTLLQSSNTHSEQLRQTKGKQGLAGQSFHEDVIDDSRQTLPLPATSNEMESPYSHEVIARADDAGLLEGVMSHMSQQVTEMTAHIQALQTSDSQQDHDIHDARTSTFVHWGSSQCGGNSSQLVYSGVVGGSYYTHAGAATNYLCLTLSPVFGNHQIPGFTALLYGAEYRTFDSVDERDPVCAVCRSTFTTTLMIPGTNVCTPGWRLLYSGYLMAGANDFQAASEYICVDSSMETSMHSSDNEEGKLLYFTTTRCGSLPCPPYEENKIVMCAVCAK